MSMFTFIHSLKARHLFPLLLVANLFAISYQFKTPDGERVCKNWFFRLATPAAGSLAGLAGGVRDLFGSFTSIRRLRRENEDLRQELSKVRFEQGLMADQLARAAQLEGLLKVLSEYTEKGVVAEITARSFQVWDRSLTIRGGTLNGFTQDLPVLDADGAVGRILQCSPAYSEVALLTNSGFAMSGTIPQKDIRGIIHGTGGPLLKMDYVHIAASVNPGDWVVSSGDDGIFPAGFPVGVVVKVDKQGQYFQDILLRPAVDVRHRRYVFVLKKTAGISP
jgi:rod shape-determining protein MreC